METVQNVDVEEAQPGRVRLFIGQLSWRMILVRLLVNGLTLILVAILVPNIYFVDRTLLNVLLMAVALGILNVFIKPIIQFLTLPFIFATYGFVVVLINTVILILLARIFEERFYVGRLIWAIVGGLVMGVVSSFLESLLGLNLPIIPKSLLAEEGDQTPAHSGRSITDILVDEMSEREERGPESSLGVARPAEVEPSPEPGGAVEADIDGEVTRPADGEEPSSNERTGPDEATDDAVDNQPGDER